VLGAPSQSLLLPPLPLKPASQIQMSLLTVYGKLNIIKYSIWLIKNNEQEIRLQFGRGDVVRIEKELAPTKRV
jgi:hypothetical protein